MPRRNNEPDLDTDTGLPRRVVLKLGTKIFLALFVLLQLLITGIVSYSQRQAAIQAEMYRKTADDVVQLRIELARIQVFLKMSLPVAAVTKKGDVQVQ